MKNIDWGLVQIQYELFGATAEELAVEYDTTPRMVEYAADQRKWKVKPVASALQDWTDIEKLENVSDEILDEVKKRLEIMRMIKTSALAPRYIALEAAIMGKALEMMQALDASDPYAAPKLKAVSDILKQLREQNGMTASPQNDPSQNLTKVMIINKVGTAPSEQVLIDTETDLVIEAGSNDPLKGGHAVAPCTPIEES